MSKSGQQASKADVGGQRPPSDGKSKSTTSQKSKASPAQGRSADKKATGKSKGAGST